MDSTIWVYFKNEERWFEVKERYVSSFPNHKKAAEYCGLPFHTFRRIGKTSNWIPKKSLDRILEKAKIDYNYIKGDIEEYINGQKERKYHLQATKTKKEIYGPNYFRELGFKKWKKTSPRERKAHSKRMCIKTMKEEKIKSIVSYISSRCNIDKKFLEYCFASYRNHGLEDFIDLFFKEEERRIVETIKNREINYQELEQIVGFDPKRLNEIIHHLNEKCLITVKIPFTNDPTFKQENIKCCLNDGGVRFKLKELCEEKANTLLKLANEVEHGYFICKKEEKLVSFEEVLKSNYKCPTCLSELVWVPDEELSIMLNAVSLVLKKVGRMATAVA
jgi:transcription initiation factor IIE alpha subunit